MGYPVIPPKQTKNDKMDFKKYNKGNENQATDLEKLFVKMYLTKDLHVKNEEFFKNTKNS